MPTTLIDEAELVWRLCEDHTQAQVAKALGWGRTDVANHVALQRLAPEAWNTIVTTFAIAPTTKKKMDVTANVTGVTSPFTENLLRDIVALTPAQQGDLVKRLAEGTIKKPKTAQTLVFVGSFVGSFSAAAESSSRISAGCLLGEPVFSA